MGGFSKRRRKFLGTGPSQCHCRKLDLSCCIRRYVAFDKRSCQSWQGNATCMDVQVARQLEVFLKEIAFSKR